MSDTDPAYGGKCKHGQVVAVTVALPERAGDWGETLAEWHRDGLTVEAGTVGELRPLFKDCRACRSILDTQPEALRVGQHWEDTEKGIEYRVGWVGVRKAHLFADHGVFTEEASVVIDRWLGNPRFRFLHDEQTPMEAA